MRSAWRKKVTAAKRQMVLETAAPLFEKEGYSAVKMQDIAGALGISVGSLYKLYPSKTALYHAYVGHQIALFFQTLLKRCDGVEEAEERLRRFVALKFEIFRQKRKAIEDPAVGDPLFFLKLNVRQVEASRPIYAFLADCFERLARSKGLKEPNGLKTAYLFNAFTTGYVEYWLHNGGDLADLSQKVVDTFLQGMADD